MFRLVFTLVLLISALALPVYVSLILAFFGIIIFKAYWETIIVFFLHDAVFGSGRDVYFNFPFFLTACIAGLVLFSSWFRRTLFERAVYRI